MTQERILVGQFGAAHGVRGEVRLKSFTQDPAAIARYGKLFDASGARSYEIASLRLLKDDLFVVRVVGVATREQAEKLTNTTLYIARKNLPAAEEDEFYHADLIGLAARTEAGDAVGTIVDVLNFGGGDILEIAPHGGGETLLIPFTKAAAPTVDIANGFVVVVPPDEVEADEDKADDDPRPGPHSPSFATGVESDAPRRSDPPRKGEGKSVR
jgi:16S rRNA processing protein RimM